VARPNVRLFGAFQLEFEAGEAVVLSYKKAKALLAFLAYHDNRPFERTKLAALLWADSAETQACESLRQTLGDTVADPARRRLVVGQRVGILIGFETRNRYLPRYGDKSKCTLLHGGPKRSHSR
jgi:DNA-binding SARP family transcriptional activator